LIRTRAGQLCSSIEQVDGLLERATGLANDLRDFVEGSEARELLPRKVRRRLEEGAERLKQAKAQAGELVDACNRVQKVLKYADRALAVGFPTGIAAVAAGVVLAGAAVAAAVVVSIGVTIIVENRNCDRVELPGFAAFIPGVDFPERIPIGEQGKVRIPRAFMGTFTVSGSQVAIEAFGRHLDVESGDLDMSQSSWDGTALSDLAGTRVSVTRGREHLLRISCR